MRRVYPRATAPPNKPLQRPNGRVVRLAVRLCRDGAGCARASSLPCHARGDRSAFAAERQIVIPSLIKGVGIMNYKRRRPRNGREGCKLCKPWKVNGYRTEREGGGEVFRPPSQEGC